MKLFAYIMSFIVLVLTAIPCPDVPEDHSVQKIELSNTTSDHHHSDADHCSPFCTCQCCQGSFYVSHSAVTFSTDIVEIPYHESSSRFQDYEVFDFLIPPQA
ncbi:MAG: DUF6660 family protein [Methylococcaceae bacterium]